MEGKSLSASDACGEEIELINNKPLTIPTAFGERGRNGRTSCKSHMKSLSVWSTESEHKAHLMNRLEDTRLTTNLYQIRKQKHIAERKFQQDLRSIRIRSARLSIPNDMETPRGALNTSRSALSSRMSQRPQNGSPLRRTPERTPLLRPTTAPPMLSSSYSQQTVTSCILCSTVRSMAMKHRRMNARTLQSTADMTESFFLSLERHGKLPDVIQSYMDHLPYCIDSKFNAVPNTAPQPVPVPARIPMEGAAVPADEKVPTATIDLDDDDLPKVKSSKKDTADVSKKDSAEQPAKEKDKVEKISIREDDDTMTITHHGPTGEVTRTLFAKDSVNWRLYNFLKSQREFNTKCSVPRHIAETNEKWCFDHSSAANLHKRRISVLPTRRKSHYKK